MSVNLAWSHLKGSCLLKTKIILFLIMTSNIISHGKLDWKRLVAGMATTKQIPERF